ncbi:MAG: radical SAM protein [Pseudomonadota bacterium]
MASNFLRKGTSTVREKAQRVKGGRDKSSIPAPYVIPFFISHQGCPHQCVFCNQHAITGSSGQTSVSGEVVADEISQTLARPRNTLRPVQVAFYGGSFTGLDRSRQEELLGAVRPFLQRGEVDFIRLSTRPDYVDEEIALFLKNSGVGLVELGIQSFDPVVLELCRRGHGIGQVENAFSHLRGAGIGVGGQLMVGLPGEKSGRVLAGARLLVALRPDLVRIYPTLVLKGSPLAALLETGHYRPLPLPRAVALCSRMKEIFDQASIPIVRMGLQPTPSLERELLAGPYHPAFGELVQARLYFRRLRSRLGCLQKERGNGTIKLLLSDSDRSLLYGRKRYYLDRLAGLQLLQGVEIDYVAGKPRMAIGHELRHS